MPEISRIPMILIGYLSTMLAAILFGVITASAQTVAVKGGMGEQGFGWMFREGGVCYVVLPAHVAGPLPRISLTSAAPVTVGAGEVIRPFWTGIDLALAVARGGIEDRCVARLHDLTDNKLVRSANAARLHRLSQSGEDEWVDLTIVEREYLTLDARTSKSTTQIYQGTSGAFAFVGAVPIGMAITSKGPSQVTLMRTEEIEMNISRFLAEQGAAFRADTAPKPVVQEGGFALSVSQITAPPVSPNNGPDKILGDGLYVFAPQRQIEIVLRVDGDAAVPLSRLVIESPVDGSYSTPRRIIIMTDASEAGERLRVWYRGEMAPDGLMDTGVRASRDVRWIKIIVASAWGAGDIAIGKVSAR